MSNKEKLYCVYKHTSPSGKVYIGITCQEPPEKRWQNGNGYKECPRFWNAICKYGWDNFGHEILYEQLSFDKACEKEKEVIFLYDSTNPSYGYNISAGGEFCPPDILISEERRKILSEKYKGENNPNYGNHKLAGENNPFYGKHHSEETKKKLSQVQTGRQSARKRSVQQFDKNNCFIAEYKSLTEASKETGCRLSDICSCCKGNLKSAGGFIWRYKEHEENT
jgi:group I intron endonuclease